MNQYDGALKNTNLFTGNAIGNVADCGGSSTSVPTDPVMLAPINNSTDSIVSFYANGTGADAIQSFVYTINGVNYTPDLNDSTFSSVVSVNTATSLTANFSGVLQTWNAQTDQIETITIFEYSKRPSKSVCFNL